VKTDLELVDLELLHVFLRLLTFFLGSVLLVLHGLDSCFEVGHGLFEGFDVSPNLKKKSAQNGGAREQHVLCEQTHLMLFYLRCPAENLSGEIQIGNTQRITHKRLIRPRMASGG